MAILMEHSNYDFLSYPGRRRFFRPCNHVKPAQLPAFRKRHRRHLNLDIQCDFDHKMISSTFGLWSRVKGRSHYFWSERPGDSDVAIADGAGQNKGTAHIILWVNKTACWARRSLLSFRIPEWSFPFIHIRTMPTHLQWLNATDQ